MNDSNADAIILDCTVRDGSYAVDFKFTEADTALLTERLAGLGFTWLEVGHGLGLGAEDAGKGSMPANDLAMIRAAKEHAGDALVGAFFIPWFGGVDLLEPARDAGLDFVRMGDNAVDIEATFPYLERARKLGIIPCVNMMKTYGVTPEFFAAQAKRSAEAGAEVVYCVDSAGGMMPRVVASYFEAARAVTDVALGFHGHNNLMLGVSNCVAAYEAGARFLDTSLCGFGRSAGNVPTELLVAVLERLDVDTGIDLFDLMDLVDRTMWPLVHRRRAHDMMGVTAGYAQFHSSFLKKVTASARSHSAELRRLVARCGIEDPVSVDDDFLEQAATELSGSAGPADHSETMALVGFHAPALAPSRISTSMQAVQDLLDALVVSGAKRLEARTALHLVPSATPSPDLVMAEFALEDSSMVLGRVTYSSEELLQQILAAADDQISVFIVSVVDGWAASAPRDVAAAVGRGRTIPVHDQELQALFLGEAIDYAAQKHGSEALLVYGKNPLVARALANKGGFDSVFTFDGGGDTPLPDGVVRLGGSEDWRNLNLMFDVVICGDQPTEADAQQLARALRPDGGYLSVGPVASQPVLDAAGDRLVSIDLNNAFAGLVVRARAVRSLWR